MSAGDIENVGVRSGDARVPGRAPSVADPVPVGDSRRISTNAERKPAGQAMRRILVQHRPRRAGR
jgi:hypothetical protein